MLGRTRWRWSLSLAGNYHGSTRFSVPGKFSIPTFPPLFDQILTIILGWCFLSEHSFPDGLPLQTAKSLIYNTDLPPKYKLKWKYMSRYFEVRVSIKSTFWPFSDHNGHRPWPSAKSYCRSVPSSQTLTQTIHSCQKSVSFPTFDSRILCIRHENGKILFHCLQ